MREFLMRSMRGGLCSIGFSKLAFSGQIKNHLRKMFEEVRNS